MRIVVVGAGGVGGYFGTRLAVAGHDVTFVARGRHLAAIQEHGLVVRSPLGEFRSTAPAVQTVADAGPADLVLVAVKLWDTEDVMAQLGATGARVLSLQNGVAKDDVLRAHVPAESVLGGACYISAGIQEPGVVTHFGGLQSLVFGEFDGRPSAFTDELLAACVDAGIDARVSAAITRVTWEKFVFLVGISATTAAVRQPIGVIRANTRTRELLRDVMTEVLAVGRAAGVDLSDDFVTERLAFVDTLPADMAASMYHDLERGSRLELPWLSGGVVSLGERLGVPTPRNRTIADVLAPYELGPVQRSGA
ncbi:ketopantoate reductase family protein [Actinophytocola oryzae]|uniref:2-dehydropantoate 2-reductase n=1 Tax=Actinophytocola oryzae TaxID=502181 RepID=A0A4R7VY92_9PSEU|nr:2-dehydropantoate 2-reductase [Actinophytocola oryzae]TDV55034.1 ketopantoate reductase [Actinophytocola oryzae]